MTRDLPPTVDSAGFFDRNALRALALAHRDRYAAAEPFPHAVLDDFLPAQVADALARAFPPPSHPGFMRRDYREQSARLGQLQRRNFAGVDPSIRQRLHDFCGMAFLDFLETLTGRPGLVADPHFRGAGLHCTLPGGHLAMHVDFNRDRTRNLSRAVTAILYVPREWKRDWGGALELRRGADARSAVAIDPMPNRLVVFDHGEDHVHGHPAPLACPEDVFRASIASYYYVAAPLPDDGSAHSARFFVDEPAR